MCPKRLFAAASGYLSKVTCSPTPDTGQHAIRRAIDLAKLHNTKIALTASEAFIPTAFGDAFGDALTAADLLFCNGVEACAITGAGTAAAAFERLSGMVSNAVVTDGPHGAYVRYAGTEALVPAVPCTPIDLTGAGDMFAGAFLYGITHDVSARAAAKAANYLCSLVITQVGARLHGGTRAAWDEAMGED